MARRIKIVVETGYVNCDYIDYMEVPDNWDEWTKEEKEKLLDDLALDLLNNKVSCCAFVQGDEDE